MSSLAEGRMKELSSDLDDLHDDEFTSKYGRSKDHMRKALGTPIKEETLDEQTIKIPSRGSEHRRKLQLQYLKRERAAAPKHMHAYYDSKIEKVRNRLAKETIDEGKAYVKPYNGGWKSSDKHGHVKFWNEHGKASAHKHAGIELKEEQIDELSKEKLGKYIDRASNDRTRQTGQARKYFNRLDGTSLALKKIVKKTDLGEEVLGEGIKKVGTYHTKSGDTVTLHQAEHDPHHHMVVAGGKVSFHIHGTAEKAHAQLKKDGFQGALHEMYHGGSAGYQQAKKGENIHHCVVMVHGVDGHRKVKKIHWAETATFDGMTAVPAGASKNDQVRKHKKEGWRVHQHFASTSFDHVKASAENHHKRIAANDRMLRDSAARRKLHEAYKIRSRKVPIDAEHYDHLKKQHEEGGPQRHSFHHNSPHIYKNDEGHVMAQTWSHAVHKLPSIEKNRHTGETFMYINEELIPEGWEGEPTGEQILQWLQGHGIKVAQRIVKQLGTVEGDEQHVEFQTKARRVGMHEDVEGVRESANWFVKHGDNRVSGPHPSEEQAIIYRDNYITSNNVELSEMELEKTGLDEANLLDEGRRGRPRKDAAPVEGDDPNIIMSLRKAAYSTVGHKIKFKNGEEHTMHSDHASKILNHFNGLRPHEKEQFQAHISQGKEHLNGWQAFHPEDHKREVPKEKKLDHRTVKKANRMPDRTETIRRAWAKIQARKASEAK